MDRSRRRYWYWIHFRRLKYAWKAGKCKTCFNTLECWYRTKLQTIILFIYDAILIALSPLTSKGFVYFALPITPCALTFPSLETSCKPLRRREANKYLTVILRTRLQYELIADDVRSAESGIAHIRREWTRGITLTDFAFNFGYRCFQYFPILFMFLSSLFRPIIFSKIYFFNHFKF